MTGDALYPHLEKCAGESARLTRLPRIRVAQIVMDQLAHGWSVEEMCRQHAHLSPAEAHAAMAYYWDHQEEIDEEIRSEWREASQDAEAAELPLFLRLQATA